MRQLDYGRGGSVAGIPSLFPPRIEQVTGPLQMLRRGAITPDIVSSIELAYTKIGGPEDKRSPKKGADSAYFQARALEGLAEGSHTRPDHEDIDKAAQTAKEDIGLVREEPELLPDFGRNPKSFMVDKPLLFVH